MARAVDVHIEAQRRLRKLLAAAVGARWRQLPGYDRRDVREFVDGAVPLVVAGQVRAAALVNAYVASVRDRPPLAVRPRTGADLRNGADPREVYERPFIQLWAALGKGVPYADAVAGGLSRVQGTVEMDVQMSARAAFQDVQDADDGLFGYIRVADGGACEFCQLVDGAYVKFGDAMALHNNCGCSLEPLEAPHPKAAKLPSGVAVHTHGELGPVLGAPDHDFTTL